MKFHVVNRKSLKSKLRSLLQSNLILSAPVTNINKAADSAGKNIFYELYTASETSLGRFDDIIFATSSMEKIISLLTKVKLDENLSSILSELKTKARTVEVYYHTDESLMPLRSKEKVNWTTQILNKDVVSDPNNSKAKKGEAMEGGESGFGNKVVDQTESEIHSSVTYNLEEILDEKVFISVNPVKEPKPEMTIGRKSLLLNSTQMLTDYQGKDGLWFLLPEVSMKRDGLLFRLERDCEDASAIAHSIMDISQDTYLSEEKLTESPTLGPVAKPTVYSTIWNTLTYTLPVEICKKMICSFLHGAIKKGVLQLKFNDGSIVSFGSPVDEEGQDKQPVVIRVFDEWFFVKTALEYDLGMAR